MARRRVGRIGSPLLRRRAGRGLAALFPVPRIRAKMLSGRVASYITPAKKKLMAIRPDRLIPSGWKA
jgi:hypothetical protein